jgi:predicted porin
MKKQLIAAAVLSTFAGVAAAQSSVTLYGVADVGISSSKGFNNATRRTEMSAGNQAGNRWGLRGTEDLGGGLKVNFTLESGFSLDTGGSGQGTTAVQNRLFGRQAWVGIEGGMGQVRFGRQDLESSTVLAGFDSFGQSFGYAGSGSVILSAGPRVDNAITLRTANLNGFTAGLQYSFRADGAEEPGSSNNAHVTSLALRYGAGPFAVGLTYDQINNPTPGAANQKHTSLGATYNFGPAQVYGLYASQRNVFSTATGETNSALVGYLADFGDSNAYTLGVAVPLGATRLFAQYARFNDKETVGGPSNGGLNVAANEDFRVISVGATYDLSKRTNFYVSYADASASGAAATASDRREQNRLNIGLRHRF